MISGCGTPARAGDGTPNSPTGVGSLVKKFIVRLVPPWTNRYPRIKRRVPTATNVHTPVRLSMTAFTALRRKLNID